MQNKIPFFLLSLGDTAPIKDIIKTKERKKVKVSVMIPSLAIHMNREVNEGYSFNAQKDMLKQAIHSVISQDYADFNFYICDDGSNNQTFDWLKEEAAKDFRIHIFKNDTKVESYTTKTDKSVLTIKEIIEIVNKHSHAKLHVDAVQGITKIKEKIRKQKELLEYLGKEEAKLLSSYLKEIVWNDITNREAHSAKVYFNALFGMEFTRTADIVINSALNYGYTIMLSAFKREIVANGYITQLGLFHDNMFNPFNLASDLIEPFRVLIDKEVPKKSVSGSSLDILLDKGLLKIKKVQKYRINNGY